MQRPYRVPDSEVLVAFLIERQAVEGISAAEMSRRLGLSEQNWYQTRRGNRRMTAPAAARARLLYPELNGPEGVAS